MFNPRSRSTGVFFLVLFSVLISGCANHEGMRHWGQCALIGAGSGGLMGGAINGGSAAAGGAVAGALLGGLFCALTERDTDGDGITNQKDQCPDTPSWIAVNESGCPFDTDNDGVPDYQDLCPRTPAGMAVNEDGCPDSDWDGVADNVDQCPNTPPSVAVDEHGCPVDSDHDGVPDWMDQCPGTEEGLQVDGQGCYIEVSEFIGEVHFHFNVGHIEDESKAFMDDVAEKMKDNPRLQLKIYGYTDSSGKPTYNVDLSMRRAQSAKDYLVSQGVEPNRITPLAGGIVPEHNNTSAGRADNRKATFFLSDVAQH